MAPPKINVKDKVSDGEIDLSMSDLQDVPVKEIAVFKKAFSLDLSNNHIATLPSNFATLTHLTKLDLSKNQLKELPENFGDLIKLKHLDLYQNQLQYLPLSFSKLKALKWLDLKDNPLVPAVAKVAGQCLDTKQCQTCARDVVNFFSQVQEQIANDIETRQKNREKQLESNQQKQMENKKNKKKDKVKAKKENGPTKENPAKPSNKKHKKTPTVPKRAETATSSLQSWLILLLVSVMSIIFVLTSIDCECTRNIQMAVVTLYHQALNVFPPVLQHYTVKLGSFVKYTHETTGNVTITVVEYVRNTDNFVNAYNALGKLIENLLNKIKEQYKQYVS